MFSPASFNGLRYALQSLWHFRRVNLAVLLGIVAATAVLTGALIVGDSVRGSLRRLAVECLGRIDQILLADHFFSPDLSRHTLGQRQASDTSSPAVPAVIVTQASLEFASAADAVHRANQVTVIGCVDSFWRLSERGARPQTVPRGRQIVLNEPLAQRLRVNRGDRVVLRLAKVSGIAQDSTLARKSDMTRNLAELEVVDIIPAEGLGRFSLRPSQALPRNAYLPLKTLQDALDQPGKVNALLFAGPSSDRAPTIANSEPLRRTISPTLEDASLKLKRIVATYRDPSATEPRRAFEYFSLTTDRMLISEASERVLRSHLSDFHVQSALTYLANSIGKVDRSVDSSQAIPYSTVSAVEFSDRLGPWIANGDLSGPLADDEIVLNSWAAEDLQAQPGAPIRLTFFEPETTHGQPRERSVVLTLKSVLALTRPTTPYGRRQPARFTRRPTWANDPDLTPEVAGVTDQESIDGWDPPFPFDYARIRKPTDEDYWDEYRTTPKALLSKTLGEQLWGSRFGKTTSLRIAIDPTVSEAVLRQRIEAAIQEDLESFGFSLLPVKQDGLRAAAGTTPFNLLFLGFSSFIIAAALMLVALLFRLSVEQRAGDAGLLLAVGLSRGRVTRLFLIEGLLISVLGAVLGALVGIGYAALMLAGLRTSWLWLEAVVTPFLQLSFRPTSLLAGAGIGVVASLTTIWWTLRGLRRVSERQLLVGQTQGERIPGVGNPIRRYVLAWLLLGIAIVLALMAVTLSGEAQAGAFFGSGACVLASLLIRIALGLRRQATSAVSSNLGTWGLALRNVARHPGRSTLTIGLMAAACFLIVAISAFRLAPSQAGSGGFALMAQSELPIFEDLNDPQVRRDLLGPKADALRATRIVPLRMQDGDDASCRNLYQSTQPRLLGITPAMSDHFASPEAVHFAWAGTAKTDKPSTGNPWALSQTNAAGTIPVILDKNTAVYSLHLYGGVGEEFELDYGSAGLLRFRVVGLLSNSILQGSLLVSEADLLRAFPRIGGYRFFLIDCPAGHTDQVGQTLEDLFSDQGFHTTETHDLLLDLLAVQNTYLSTFQSLGGLGLLLGTFGLVAVQLRSVFERRGELALLRAVGFAQRRIASLVMLEHAVLLLGGLGVGLVAAVVAVLPHAWTGGAHPPVGTLSVVLAVILGVGLVSGAIAVRQIVRVPVLGALRGD